MGWEHEAIYEEKNLLAGQKLPNYVALIALCEMGESDLLGIHVMQIRFATTSLAGKNMLLGSHFHGAHFFCHRVKNLTTVSLSRATRHCDLTFYVAVDNLFSCLHRKTVM